MLLAPSIPYTVHAIPAPEGIGGIYKTLRVMRDFVREGSRNPTIRQCAVSLIFLQPQKAKLHEIDTVFSFVRDSIRYVHDPVDFESVAAPEYTLGLRYGDCDDQCVLLGALLESVGYPVRFVIAGYAVDYPEHVYLQVLADDEWINCDPTEPEPLGFAPPFPVFLEIERV